MGCWVQGYDVKDKQGGKKEIYTLPWDYPLLVYVASPNFSPLCSLHRTLTLVFYFGLWGPVSMMIHDNDRAQLLENIFEILLGVAE